MEIVNIFEKRLISVCPKTNWSSWKRSLWFVELVKKPLQKDSLLE